MLCGSLVLYQSDVGVIDNNAINIVIYDVTIIGVKLLTHNCASLCNRCRRRLSRRHHQKFGTSLYVCFSLEQTSFFIEMFD